MTKLDELGLMPKTVAILRDNGIETLEQLLALDEDALSNMAGLSRHRATKVSECIQRYCDALDDEFVSENMEDDDVRRRAYYDSVGEYLENQKVSPRNLEILTYYYSEAGSTLESVASRFGVTRERVRQICARCVNDVRVGFNVREINPVILETMEQAAEEKTELGMVNISDELLGRDGAVRVITLAFGEKYEILNHSKLNGEWLVMKEENVGNMIDYLSKTLQERDTPMKIDEVMTLFPIKEDMLFSMKNLIEKDGYVTLSTNKMVTGRIPRIKGFLLSIGRPASISEIAEGTGMSLNQVRGAVCNKNEFENVGRNVYDSVETNYLNLSPSDLAKNLLIAEDRAIPVDRLVDYVKKYAYDLTKMEIMVELFSAGDSAVYNMDNYALLKEWGPDKIEVPVRRNYAIELKDAIMYVVPELDGVFDAERVQEAIIEKYGDTASSNYNSIRATLGTLARDNKIIEVGSGTGCYRRV